MTIREQVIQQLDALPTEKQSEVLVFIENLKVEKESVAMEEELYQQKLKLFLEEREKSLVENLDKATSSEEVENELAARLGYSS